MSRNEAPLNPDRTLDLGHHILKAHIYKNMQHNQIPVPPRDLQALWVAQSVEDASLALGKKMYFIHQIGIFRVKKSQKILYDSIQVVLRCQDVAVV